MGTYWNLCQVLSTRERKYADVSYSNGVLASVSTSHQEQEMAAKKYVTELMGQSTKASPPLSLPVGSLTLNYMFSRKDPVPRVRSA